MRSKFKGRVVHVVDGDTVLVSGRERDEFVRLADIDCPEEEQSFGKQAKVYVEQLALGKDVVVRAQKHRDQYDRLVGQVLLPGGMSLNHELVKAGLAWWFRRYCPKDKELERLEAVARSSEAGLWGEANPIAPWEFRDAERNRRERDVITSASLPEHARCPSRIRDLKRTLYWALLAAFVVAVLLLIGLSRGHG